MSDNGRYLFFPKNYFLGSFFLYFFFALCSAIIGPFIYPSFVFLLLFLLSAAQPTDQGEEGVVVVVVVVVVVGFGGTVFGSPMYTQNGCIQRKLFFKMGASRENFSLKWVYPEKLFFKLGVSRETFFQNGCIKSLFLQNLKKKNYSIFYSLLSCHKDFSFDVIQSKSDIKVKIKSEL